MRFQKMLSLKITQNNEIYVYHCDMSQAKEDVALRYITYLFNQFLAESMSSNLQAQPKKKEFKCKTRIAQPYYRHCSRNRIIQKNN